MIRTTASALLLCGLLGGCGAGGSGNESTDASEAGVEANTGEHMLSEQQRALENAQSAAGAMEESNRSKQQALEEAQQ